MFGNNNFIFSKRTPMSKESRAFWKSTKIMPICIYLPIPVKTKSMNWVKQKYVELMVCSKAWLIHSYKFFVIWKCYNFRIIIDTSGKSEIGRKNEKALAPFLDIDFNLAKLNLSGKVDSFIDKIIMFLKERADTFARSLRNLA